MEAPILWGFVMINKRAAFCEFKWIVKNSQSLREVKFYLLNIS